MLTVTEPFVEAAVPLANKPPVPAGVLLVAALCIPIAVDPVETSIINALFPAISPVAAVATSAVKTKIAVTSLEPVVSAVVSVPAALVVDSTVSQYTVAVAAVLAATKAK